MKIISAFFIFSTLLGGEVISGYSQGQAIAEMGMKFLDGTVPDELPLTVESRAET